MTFFYSGGGCEKGNNFTFSTPQAYVLLILPNILFSLKEGGGG